MALKNSVISTFSILLASFSLNAKIILPELLTKQAVPNIRFLSKDGKFTYYQKRSGSLLFSTNYKVQEMIKGEIGTNYTLFATPARKKIVILQNMFFHNFYSIRAKENIFLVDYGESTPQKIAEGISPKLHLDDSWLSFYDPYTKTIHFENTANAALKFSIKLNNRINPYFTPQVLMSDDNTVYYTDLSETGHFGLLEFKRNTAKSEIIYKATTPMSKIEICLNENNFILGLFGIHSGIGGSLITKSPLPLKNFDKRESIYSSELNDLGHLTCDYEKDTIAFIKNFGTKKKPSFDITALNTTDKKLTPLSEIKSATHIINMDGVLLTEEKGKYLIVKGNVDFKNVDSLKSKTDIPSEVNEDKDLENE